jgi:hypothetical protein
MLQYDKPWEKLDTPEKVERLHKDLRAFIDFYNDAVLKRNERLESLGEALKRIESRLDVLERKTAS